MENIGEPHMNTWKSTEFLHTYRVALFHIFESAKFGIFRWKSRETPGKIVELAEFQMKRNSVIAVQNYANHSKLDDSEGK